MIFRLTLEDLGHPQPLAGNVDVLDVVRSWF